jgi:AraC family transcriptional regulator of adaptative response/methylated-DNA-[protein]-cysteine methyltransferase
VFIFSTEIETPIGRMTACANNEGICLLEFNERKDLNRQMKSLKAQLKTEIIEGENDRLKNLKKQLAEYFSGKRKIFNLPLVMTGTAFQQKVWKALQEIPFGKKTTYRELTNKLRDPKAIRAVAGANGANKMAIIIPCHRVIGSDGSLTGYAGGLWRKQWLLDHESEQAKINFIN